MNILSYDFQSEPMPRISDISNVGTVIKIAVRNFFTDVGAAFAGKGTSFGIKFAGYGKINQPIAIPRGGLVHPNN